MSVTDKNIFLICHWAVHLYFSFNLGQRGFMSRSRNPPPRGQGAARAKQVSVTVTPMSYVNGNDW